jgi:predicted TIM-barrel fold metal-dependent hydrolase
MFPTLASLVEERMRDDPELIHAVIHALNQWLHETWTFNYSDRIFTTPVISLPIVDRAIEELDWCLERGARAILVRPAPVPGFRGPRSFALPEFDPFWKRVEEAGILVAMHSSDSGYARYVAEWEGNRNEMLPFKPNAFRMVGEWRPIQDAVAAWVCHGALFRFPDLKIALIENGSSWVEPLLKQLADLYKKMPQDFAGDPVEAVKTKIHVSPFYEDDLSELTELIGVDRVLFGSDYPHPEGLAHPSHYLDAIKTLNEADQAKIMGGNLARLIPA